MPGVNSIANTTATFQVDSNPIKESLRLNQRVKERLRENNFDDALNLTYQIVHSWYKSDAIQAIFSQFVVKRPLEVVALLELIQDPEIKKDCQTFACFKLKQLGFKALVKQISDASESAEVKRTAARLLQSP